ncbi:MAG: GNAT family N-acetyltransferase [Mycobacterium sp.]
MDVVVVQSSQIDVRCRLALRELWDYAFGSRFTDADAGHAYGGVHVLACNGDRLIGHASAVPRSIKFGERPWRTIGYVEAVATHPSEQRRGVGRLVMGHLHGEITSRWGLALLSTGRATAFYESLGWVPWQGASYTVRGNATVADGEQGGLMVYGHQAAGIDRKWSVSCRDRPGDAW